ncbi:hypothetical protein P4O66_007408 [Electrophorus voltai]|uniref:Uncharacterized protein n=1 Tax=Electrophorus voltai TaxID=2609070 RepID=A0AAD8ZGR1_9TELE|nr:hypothetical protein P4O66_007408 [Electrophorus voltai]
MAESTFGPYGRVKATECLPHRSWGCAVELLPGAPLPWRAKPYTLSQPEEAAMEAYVAEALQHSFIQPSTSSVAAGFFFWRKKGGGGIKALHLLPGSQQSDL